MVSVKSIRMESPLLLSRQPSRPHIARPLTHCSPQHRTQHQPLCTGCGWTYVSPPHSPPVKVIAAVLTLSSLLPSALQPATASRLLLHRVSVPSLSLCCVRLCWLVGLIASMADRLVVMREAPVSLAKARQRLLTFLAEQRVGAVVSLDADGDATADEVAAQLQRISRIKVADDFLFQLQQITDDMQEEEEAEDPQRLKAEEQQQPPNAERRRQPHRQAEEEEGQSQRRTEKKKARKAKARDADC